MWIVILSVAIVLIVLAVLFFIVIGTSSSNQKLGAEQLDVEVVGAIPVSSTRFENFMRAVIQADQEDSQVILAGLTECYPIYVDAGALLLDEFDTRNPTWITLSSLRNIISDLNSAIKPGMRVSQYITQNLPRFIEIIRKNINNENFSIIAPQSARWSSGLIMNSLNQGSCGSCWVFSSATAVSDRYRIEYNRKTISNIGTLMNNIYYYVNLENKMIIDYSTVAKPNYTRTLNSVSPYELGACANIVRTGDVEAKIRDSNGNVVFNKKNDPSPSEACTAGNISPCNTGGYPDNAMNYLRLVGAKNTLYFNGSINSEEYRCPSCSKGQYTVCDYIAFGVVGGRSTVEECIYDYKKELYANGPFVVAFVVYENFYQYKSGVYSNISGRNTGGHAVTIIGWTTVNGVPCWIVRNSWGSDWGMNGNFLISFSNAQAVGMYGTGNAPAFNIVAPLISCPQYLSSGCKIKTLSTYPASTSGIANCSQCPIFI